MEIVLQYFDGCPGWRLAEERLRVALTAAGTDATVTQVEIATLAEAERVGFTGSPTLLIDGRDRFGDTGAAPSLACRRYMTEAGVESSPSVEQLLAAIRDG
jgi:hypothetical protein